MVNPIIILGAIGAAALVFTAGGGFDKSRDFFNSITNKGNISTVETQNAKAKSSQTAITQARKSNIFTTNVSSKRKNVPKVGTGFTAQFSDASSFQLTDAQKQEIRSRPFTDQELKDINALNARRAKSEGTRKFSLKQSGEEVVLQKREQEALAKENLTSRFGSNTFVDGKLFANSGFAGFIKTGQGKLTESQNRRLGAIRKAIDPRNMSQEEIREIQQNIIKNKQIAAERDQRGKQIQSNLDSKGITQNQAVLAKGAILRGGNTLNARALAKLQEKGLI